MFPKPFEGDLCPSSPNWPSGLLHGSEFAKSRSPRMQIRAPTAPREARHLRRAASEKQGF
eukprot:7895949-Alexandrium_andersonii.AAC.1